MRFIAHVCCLFLLLTYQTDAAAQCGWQPGLEAAGTNGSVHALLPWDPDGPDGPQEELLVIAGDFSTAGSVEAANIAVWRQSDRTWQSLGTGFGPAGSNNHVVCLVSLPDGSLVAGGYFQTTRGAPANFVAKWNGTEWVPIGSPLNAAVRALAVSADGRLIAGGNFRLPSEGGLTSIAALENGAWIPLRAGEWDGVFGYVTHVVALPDGEIIAAGPYLNEFDETRAPIAIWNGTEWFRMGISAGTIDAMAVSVDGRVAIAGSGLGPEYLAIWHGDMWDFVDEPYGAIETREMVFLSTGELVVDFSMGNWGLPGIPSGPHKWDGSTWMRLGTGRPGSNYAEAIVRLSDDRVILARQAPEIWDGSRWWPLGRGISGELEDVMAKPGGGVYIAGSFDWVADQSAMGVAQSTESGWQALGDAVSPGGGVTSMLLTDDETLMVVGGFYHETTYGTITVGTWDGSAWQFMPAPPRPTYHPVTPRIFWSSEGLLGFIANSPYVWTGDSWTQTPTGFNSLVYTACVDRSGDIVFGGVFTTPGNRIAKWNGISWEALGVGLANGYCYSLLEHSNGDLIVGGSFRTAGGHDTNYIARWDGIEWHDLAGGMSPHATVLALAELPNGDIVAGGGFTSAGGVEASNIARWDGSQWHPLGGGTNGIVTSLDVLEDGSLAVGGRFTHVDGKPSAYYARYVFEGEAPEVTEQPEDAFACAFAAGQVRVGSTPVEGVAFQWQVLDNDDWTALVDGDLDVDGRLVAEITGSQANLLSLLPRVDVLSVQLRCVLDNGCGIATSMPATISACRPDLTCDGSLDMSDAIAFLDAFFACDGAPAGCSFDAIDPNVNGDDVVDVLDFLDYIDAYGSGC